MANVCNAAAVAALELLEEEDAARNYMREDPFEVMGDIKFKKYFRLTKNCVREVINVLAPHIRPPSRESSFSIPFKVLVTLRFFASGTYQLDVGSNYCFQISQSSVSRCISEVTEAFNQPHIIAQYVQFPSTREGFNSIKNGFLTKYNFPGIIGCIDCTHIAIAAPPGEDEHIYINRKNYHSLNVQLICDHNLKILSANANFPGRTHDAYIWQHSNVRQVIEQIYRDGNHNQYLLGDSGYPLRPWLMTPVDGDHQADSPEDLYNRRHSRARCTIERCNGLLKSRFRCLSKQRVLNYLPQKAAKITVACIILHNICVNNGIEPPQEEEALQEDDRLWENLENPEEQRPAVNPDLQRGRLVRNVLINEFAQ